MSEGVRTALLALLGLLVVIFGCLIAFAFVIRRRPGIGVIESDPEADPATPVSESDSESAADSSPPIRDPMVCSTCRREFASHLKYCPHDATELVPAPDMLTLLGERRIAKNLCPRCQQDFPGATRFCPHDGSELLPIAAEPTANVASHSHSHDDERGAIGKICPECRGRYKYAASFCGKDGVELVVLN